MRWGRLFEDLEAGWQAEQSRLFDAEVADRLRAERAGVELASRLVAARGTEVALTLLDGSSLRGTVVEVAQQWILMSAPPREHLVPVGAISAAAGLPARAVPLTEVERRLSLGTALRALARDRARVTIRAQGLQVSGLVEAVGADHVDVARDCDAHATLPFLAILEVRSAHA